MPYSHFTHRARKRRSQEANPTPSLLRATGPPLPLLGACCIQDRIQLASEPNGGGVLSPFHRGKELQRAHALPEVIRLAGAELRFSNTKAHAASSPCTLPPFCSREMAKAGKNESIRHCEVCYSCQDRVCAWDLRVS